MGEIIIPNAVVRKPGYLYYIDSEGSVCEAQMKHDGGPRGKGSRGPYKKKLGRPKGSVSKKSMIAVEAEPKKEKAWVGV